MVSLRERSHFSSQEMNLSRERASITLDYRQGKEVDADTLTFAQENWRESAQRDRIYLENGATLAGVFESIHATEKLKEAMLGVSSCFADNSMLAVGSLSWGGYYAPMMDLNTEKPASDLDVEIVVDDYEDLVNNRANNEILDSNPELVQGLRVFVQLADDNEIDYFSHKISHLDTCVSIHITPRKTIQSLALSDLCYLKTETLRELRIQPKSKPPVYAQRNFFGDILLYPARVTKYDGILITETPKQIIRDGKFYPGVLMDKYLHHPTIVRDTLDISTELVRLRMSVEERRRIEQSNSLRPLKFSHCLSRFDRTPYDMIARIEEGELYGSV